MKDGRHGADVVRIGTAAGMADDRIYPGVQLLERAALDYVVCECLAERTIARETLNRIRNPELGYTPMLLERIRAFMPLCLPQRIKMVTNMGAANPLGAVAAIRRECKELGLGNVVCAAVTGDDITELLRGHPELELMNGGGRLEALLPKMASANAYLGADVIGEALDKGAQVVVTGRVADPSMYLGILLHHFGWSYDDWQRMAAGTVMGHMLECSVQVTGGYFADPGKKDVRGLADLAYPFADVTRSGGVTISKTPGTGGRVDRMTCSEQILYEIHDPANYITPDCVVDLLDVDFKEEGEDRVEITGARAKPRTDTYKAVVGYFDGYIGSGEISYAGINAVARARLAAEVVKERFRMEGGSHSEIRVDLIGLSSLHEEEAGRAEPYEVRLRVAARCPDKKSADLIGDQVRQLNMQGPCGPGGPLNSGAREVIAVESVLVPRSWVHPQITLEG